MSLKKKNRNLLAAAEVQVHSYNRGGLLSVCLVAPNQYATGMSSLGFQTVYRLFACEAEIRCERAFLPERDELESMRQSGAVLKSFESSIPLSHFDVIAFSTSFEPDYQNIPLILKLAKIPCYSNERTSVDPLIIGGGAAFFINPEPVADLLDAICIGEGEDCVPALVQRLLAPVDDGRQALLRALSAIPGFYVPFLYRPQYHDGVLSGYEHDPHVPFPVQRQSACLEQHPPASSQILTEQSEFGDMFLIEVSRGCPRGCRFCSSGFIYGAFRQQPFEQVKSLVDEGLRFRSKIGLVGAAVSDHAEIGRLCSYVVASGGKVSVSSLRMDRIDPEMLDALLASGHKTIALAPEGGSQRLRNLIRKNLSEEQILAACDLLISRDILNLKLYIIIGLPDETEDDLDELIRLVSVIRERVIERSKANKRLGEIILSVNPFIPKPFTPFQWCGMEALPSLERKIHKLEKSLRRLSNVKLKVESLRESVFQALLSRGDRRLTPLLVAMAEGSSLKQAARQCAINVSAEVEKNYQCGDLLPWSVIRSADETVLQKDFMRAFATGES